MDLKPGNAAGVDTTSDASVQKPILVYDGECAFCRYWVNWWKRNTEEEVHFVPFQELPPVYYGISRDKFQKSVYLITQYRRLHGAEAVFELLSIGGNNSWIKLYRRYPLADKVFEFGYRLVADNRDFFYKILKIFVHDA